MLPVNILPGSGNKRGTETEKNVRRRCNIVFVRNISNWSCNSITTRKWVNVLHSKNTPEMRLELTRSHTSWQPMPHQYLVFQNYPAHFLALFAQINFVCLRFSTLFSEYFRFHWKRNPRNRIELMQFACIHFLISLAVSVRLGWWLIAPAPNFKWFFFRSRIEFKTISVTIYCSVPPSCIQQI